MHAVVYRAHRAGAEYAVKLLRPDTSVDDETSHGMFCREASVLASLRPTELAVSTRAGNLDGCRRTTTLTPARRGSGTPPRSLMPSRVLPASRTTRVDHLLIQSRGSRERYVGRSNGGSPARAAGAAVSMAQPGRPATAPAAAASPGSSAASDPAACVSRPGHLPAQHRELSPKNRDLDLLAPSFLRLGVKIRLADRVPSWRYRPLPMFPNGPNRRRFGSSNHGNQCGQSQRTRK
jgi:hypothetical protein